VFLDFHVWLPPTMPLVEAHALSHVVKDRLMAKYPQIADAIMHLEPTACDRVNQITYGTQNTQRENAESTELALSSTRGAATRRLPAPLLVRSPSCSSCPSWLRDKQAPKL